VRRHGARWLAASTLAVVLLGARTLDVSADCGDTTAAVLNGDWQMKITVAGFSIGTSSGFSRFPAGFTIVDRVRFTATCTAVGQCTVVLDPADPTVHDSDFEATGPDKPMPQAGNAYTVPKLDFAGVGGPNLPQCTPPDLRASLNLTVVAAARDASGSGWHATMVTGDEFKPGLWTCNGSVGVPGSIEHLALVAVPTGNSFPASIDAACGVTATPAAVKPPNATAATPPNPDRSTIAATLSSPADAFKSPTRTITNALITVAVILFITFPSQLFNRTFEENYDEIRDMATRRLRWLARLRERAGDTPSGPRNAAAFVAVLVIGTVLGGLNDPHFGFNRPSVATFLAIVLAILLGVAVAATVGFLYRRARHRAQTAHLHALPAGLLVAGTCVLLSRLTDFTPGYLYGVICGLAFTTHLARNEEGHNVALGSVATMVVAVIAWFIWVPVNDAASRTGAPFGTVLAGNFLAAVFVGGLVGSVVNLFPLRFLPGGTLAGWSRVAWTLCFGVALFGLVHVMLRPESAAAHPGNAPLVTAIVLFVVVGGMSVAFRVYFERRRRQREAAKATAA
jgi:hypothetical protein